MRALDGWTFAGLPPSGEWLHAATVNLETLHGAVVERRVVLTKQFVVFGDAMGRALDWMPLHEVSSRSDSDSA